MDHPHKAAIQLILRERRQLINQVRRTEDKLARLKARLTLANVKLSCFGYQPPKQQPPTRMFRGRSIIRRVLDLQRSVSEPLTIEEIAERLAARDRISLDSAYRRASAVTRVRDAMKRTKRLRR